MPDHKVLYNKSGSVFFTIYDKQAEDIYSAHFLKNQFFLSEEHQYHQCDYLICNMHYVRKHQF